MVSTYYRNPTNPKDGPFYTRAFLSDKHNLRGVQQLCGSSGMVDQRTNVQRASLT